MRTDEFGRECPATLGEYRDLCAKLGGDDCQAVEFVDRRIARAPGGRDEPILAEHSQVRALLLPMIPGSVIFP